MFKGSINFLSTSPSPQTPQLVDLLIPQLMYLHHVPPEWAYERLGYPIVLRGVRHNPRLFQRSMYRVLTRK